MVTGMERFRQHFAGYEDAFVVIGGAACNEWFARAGARFRTTKDIDMVLLLEAAQSRFAGHLWAFIRAGGYQVGQRRNGRRTYFRFTKPTEMDYPKTIELFASAPLEIEPAEGQEIVPIPLDDDVSSLSAILLDPAYYQFILGQREVAGGLPLIRPSGLIPLKARAWLDLSRRRAAGDTSISEDDINKHRTDIFRLATLLPTGNTLVPPAAIAADLDAFLKAFPATSPAWPDISRSLATTSSIRLPPRELLDILGGFYGRPA